MTTTTSAAAATRGGGGGQTECFVAQFAYELQIFLLVSRNLVFTF